MPSPPSAETLTAHPTFPVPMSMVPPRLGVDGSSFLGVRKCSSGDVPTLFGDLENLWMPHPWKCGSVQGQTGWVFEKSGLVEGVSPHSRG